MKYTAERRYRRIARWFDRRASRLAQQRVNRACAAGKLWQA